MFVVVTSSLGVGLLVLVKAWSSLGLEAFLLAPAIASASGLLASLLLGRLRRDRPTSASIHTKVPRAAISARPANNPEHPVP
jgi:hypothetical protein